MTSRQRILEAFRHGSPDRTPVSPFTLGALDRSSSIADELIEKTDPLISVNGGGNPFYGSAIKTRVTENGNSRATVWETPKGELTSVFQWTEITASTVEYPIKTTEDAERFLSMPFAPAVVDLADYRKWCSRVGEEGLILLDTPNAICFPASWLSPEDFCLWWMDNHDLLIELTKVASERVNEYVHRQCHEGAGAFRIIGGEYASVQLGPSGFDALVTPFDTELVDIIHSHGAVAYYHNHGNMSGFLDRLADLGMDALDPLEAPPWGDCEIGDAVKRIGDRVCLVGNLDDMEIIERLPTEEVVRIAEERLDAAGASGFVLGGTASGTYTERGARNFIAIADMVRRKQA